MIFTTIEEYDKELKDMELELKETEEYLKNHPEKQGTKGNYETMKYLYNLISQNRIEFIKEINNFNLRLYHTKESLPINSVYKLNKRFNEITNSITSILENNNYQEELHLKSISKGSYKITFAFPNPTEEDVKRTSSRKKGLMKIFDFINCSDDIEKLKNTAGPNGEEALKSYKKFLAEIVRLNADFTLDTEMETVKAGLKLEQCQKICENLNV